MKTILSVYKNMQDKNASSNTELNIHSMNSPVNLFEQNPTFFKYFITLSLLLYLIFQAGNVKAQTSCVVAGVTITATGSANVAYFSGSNTGCPASPFSGDGAWTGATSGGIVTYTFSSPITSALVRYTIVNGNDIGTISVNGGGTPTLSNPCAVNVSGLILSSAVGAASTWGDISIRVTSTLPFTTITLTNTGGQTGWVQGNPCDITFTRPCGAGTSAPTLSAITKANACPTTTVDLTTITASNMPAGATLTWHTGTPATTANKITGTAVAAGTYYAAFFDATNNCYSGTSGAGTTAVTATVNPCLVQSDKCGFEAGDGCPNTDYSNFGLYSNNNPATIEYDNFMSVFHSTIVRNSNGSFSGWGAHMANDGTSDATTPRAINATNYPALGTHKILKVTGASWGGGNAQFIALTSDGLYAWGGLGFAISSTLKNTTAFGRVANTNGSSNLPPDVTPADVKMITASNDYVSTTVTGGNIVLTTCGGAVWVIGSTASARGNGATGNINTWYQVMKAPGVPLTNIVSARINHNAVLALDSNNTLWTWGSGTFLGNNSFAATRNYATQMEHPAPSKTIKMIGMTRSNTNANKNYYVLMTDGNLYSLGQNAAGELGIWNTAASTGWVQPRYTSSAGPVMNDIKWISPNENDNAFGAINVINSAGVLYAWGNNNFNMLGFPTTGTSNPGIHSGLSGSQKIIAVETGGAYFYGYQRMFR
jgi:alpha-tubulin suppressor-like RCC1 family protein